MTVDGKGGTPEKPHRFAAKTPEGIAKQQSNLKPQAAISHGAYSPEKLRPLREAIVSELEASFPSVRRDRLQLAATQRARIALLSDYLEDVGLIAHRKRGTFRPALTALQRDEESYRRELEKIEDLAREAPAAGSSLAAIAAELAAGDDDDDEDAAGGEHAEHTDAADSIDAAAGLADDADGEHADAGVPDADVLEEGDG